MSLKRIKIDESLLTSLKMQFVTQGSYTFLQNGQFVVVWSSQLDISSIPCNFARIQHQKIPGKIFSTVLVVLSCV
jgi:hypothetical protein